MSILDISSNSVSAQGEPLSFEYGWKPSYAHALVEQSKEPHILEWTPEDSHLTYNSLRAAIQWGARHQSSSVMVWLPTPSGELAGRAHVLNIDGGGQTVFGVRVYEGYEGQGIGRALTERAHELFDEINNGTEHSSRFTVHGRNQKAVALGFEAGYVQDDDVYTKLGHMSMVRRPSI